MKIENNIAFRGRMIENTCLNDCLKNLSKAHRNEYKQLIKTASKTKDGIVLEAYSRVSSSETKGGRIYNYYVGLRDKYLHGHYGEGLVRVSYPNGNSNHMLWGYIDGIIKPLRRLYKKSN